MAIDGGDMQIFENIDIIDVYTIKKMNLKSISHSPSIKITIDYEQMYIL